MDELHLLMRVRHHCFRRGVMDSEHDYRMAFRTVNGLYVALKGHRIDRRGVASQRKAVSRLGRQRTGR